MKGVGLRRQAIAVESAKIERYLASHFRIKLFLYLPAARHTDRNILISSTNPTTIAVLMADMAENASSMSPLADCDLSILVKTYNPIVPRVVK